MPRHATVSVPAKTWTELTASNATNVTFENMTPGPLFLSATTGAAPADLDGAVLYQGVSGDMNVSLTDTFAGVSGAVRLWAWSKTGARVAVSHA